MPPSPNDTPRRPAAERGSHRLQMIVPSRTRARAFKFKRSFAKH